MKQPRRSRIAPPFLVLATVCVPAAAPASGVVWSETLGGALDDGASATVSLPDGGALVVGRTRSFGAGGDDALVVRLAAGGGVSWAKTYGGPGDDVASAVVPVGPGFLVVGSTASFGAAGKDLWLLRLDDSGGISWQERIGGPLDDEGNAVSMTASGTDFLVAGRTASFGAASFDAWALRVSLLGAVVWQKRYGGAGLDQAFSIRPGGGAGILVAGETRSFTAGSSAPWLLNLSTSGAINWQKTYDAFGSGLARSALGTADGGFVVAGEVRTTSAAGADDWVAKLDAAGLVAWERVYASDGVDELSAIWPTPDQDFVLAGAIHSAPAAPGDAWVARIAGGDGSVIWQRAHGGAATDRFTALWPGADQHWVLAGETSSSGAGGNDAWSVRVDANGLVTCGCNEVTVGTASVSVPLSVVTDSTATAVTTAGARVAITAPGLTIAPATAFRCAVPVQDWTRAIGTPGLDTARAVAVAPAGGYFVAGWTTATPGGADDGWVTRLDADGHVIWQAAYGNGDPAGGDRASAILATADGGCLVAGSTPGFRASGGDGWLLKLAADGSIEWSGQFGVNLDDGFVAVVANPDLAAPGYLAAGTLDAGVFAGKEVWVLAVDLGGNYQWEFTYGGGGDDVARAMAATADGAIIAATSNSFGATSYEPWVVKVDTAGYPEWAKTYEDSGADAFNSIAVAGSGYLAAGEVRASGPSGPDAWLVRLDADGEIVWQKAYGDPVIHPADPDQSDRARAVQAIGDGFLVAGTTHSVLAFRDLAWLFRVDGGGAVRWQKAYGLGPIDELHALAPIAAGGVLAVGDTTRAGSVDGLLWTTDPEGPLACVCDGVETAAVVWTPTATARPAGDGAPWSSVVDGNVSYRTVLGGETTLCPAP